TGTPIQLPYWLMSADEFRRLVIGKTEEEATSQNNIVYKALTYARMVAANLVAPSPSNYGGAAPTDGLPADEPRPRTGVSQDQITGFDRDKPRPFSLQEFQNHILFLQAARDQGGRLAPITATDFSKSFKSILDKFSVLRRDPRIRFLITEWSAASMPLGQIVGQLVGASMGDNHSS